MSSNAIRQQQAGNLAKPASHAGSYQEATARERLARLFDAGSFEEFLPPSARVVSPHLGQLNAPVAFDDGVAVGRAQLGGVPVYVAAQEGGFMGGAVGEVHGAKLVGLLRRAAADVAAPVGSRAAGVVLLVESGGVRLHEANAGLIAVSEVMRALLDARAAGVPVIVLVGGANGAFGGMGIVARCANAVIMSEEGRLAMSGPEVIETASGVEEFDARDRALVWRTTGGKHRYLLGDCQRIVADDIAAFRTAAQEALACYAVPTAPAEQAMPARQPIQASGVTGVSGADAARPVALTLAALEAEQLLLAERLAQFGAMADPVEIWQALGVSDAANVPMLDVDSFIAAAAGRRKGE